MKKMFKALGALTTASTLFSTALMADMPAANQPMSKQSTWHERFIAYGELLYWQANSTNLTYALNAPVAASTAVGSYVRPTFNFDPGFRVGIGYEVPHGMWDLTADWTRFYTTGSSTTTAAVGGAIVPNTGSFGGVSFASASSTFQFQVDMVDLKMSRKFEPCKWLDLHVNGGLRTQWLRETAASTFNTPARSGQKAYTSGTTYAKNTNWGLGPIVGLDLEWKLSRDWSIMTNAAASLMYGYNEVVNSNGADVGVADYPYSTSDSYRVSRSDLDTAIGLKWGHDFKEVCTFSLALMWEHHMFFEQNFSAASSVSTSGVTAAASLQF